MLEVRQVMTKYVQRLQSRTPIEMLLVLLSPLLKALYVLVQGRFVLQEILIVIFLLKSSVPFGVDDYQQTYACRSRQIGSQSH